jgi:hypothetical protein
MLCGDTDIDLKWIKLINRLKAFLVYKLQLKPK